MLTHANATAIPEPWQAMLPADRDHEGHPLCLLGPSIAAQAMRGVLRALARTDYPVLLRGGPGTGKREFAEELHRRRGGAAGGFQVLDCTATAEARPQRRARGVGIAGSGSGETWYVTDLERLSDMQHGALVRTLGTAPRTTHVIVATTADVDELVAHGRLRADLASLFTIRVTLPPLRDRLDDVATITQGCIRRWSDRSGGRCPDVSSIALAYLRAYTWPQNIRELEDVVVTACSRTRARAITGAMISAVLGARPRRNAGADIVPLREVERNYILIALARCGQNQSLAARRLQIGRNTLTRKLHEPQAAAS
jgi:DNA-binding NtrC family response regulator